MDLPQAIKHVSRSTVKITFHATPVKTDTVHRFSDGSLFETRIIGTGFLVNKDGFVLTAHHVMEYGRRLLGEYRNKSDEAGIFVGFNSSNVDESIGGLRVQMSGFTTIVESDVFSEDKFNDVCLLRPRRNPFKNEVKTNIELTPGRPVEVNFDAVKFMRRRPDEGVQIGLSGYSYGDVLITNSGHVASSWYSLEKSINEGNIETPTKKLAHVYLIDCESNPGNSGGPVYLAEDASIIGMLSACEGSPVWDYRGDFDFSNGPLFYGSGLGIVVTAETILNFLDKHGVSYEEV